MNEHDLGQIHERLHREARKRNSQRDLSGYTPVRLRHPIATSSARIESGELALARRRPDLSGTARLRSPASLYILNGDVLALVEAHSLEFLFPQSKNTAAQAAVA